jgi:6-pyruvoyltetrahydropterin/6-carboxytetrahydropterin synthase
MFTISKTFTFSASHRLEGLADDHPCSRLHGHNYSVTVTVQSPVLSEVGFVRDYRSLDWIKKIIDEQFDHRHLNDLVNFNPTAELLAKCFFDLFQPRFGAPVKLKSVTVKETDKTSAIYDEA